MTQEHPITPPPELVKQWVSLACEYEGNETWIDLATQAARWGADQELEACKVYLAGTPYPSWAIDLHSARRPKPPSLKEQAIETLHMIRDHLPGDMYDKTFLIRSALESLPD